MKKKVLEYSCVFVLDLVRGREDRCAVEIRMVNDAVEGPLRHPDGKSLDWIPASGRSEAAAWVVLNHLFGADTADRWAPALARQVLEKIPPRGGRITSGQLRRWLERSMNGRLPRHSLPGQRYEGLRTSHPG